MLTKIVDNFRRINYVSIFMGAVCKMRIPGGVGTRYIYKPLNLN